MHGLCFRKFVVYLKEYTGARFDVSNFDVFEIVELSKHRIC